MSWIAGIEEYGIREFCSGVVNYALNDSKARESTQSAGYWIIKGAYVDYLAIKDLCKGKIKLGLLKSSMGTLFIANGVLKLISVASDAYDIQCRMWPHLPEGEDVYVQGCSAFECKPPLSMRVKCNENDKCDFSTLGSVTIGGHLTCHLLKEPVDTYGFSSVYEMNNAALR